MPEHIQEYMMKTREWDWMKRWIEEQTSQVYTENQLCEMWRMLRTFKEAMIILHPQKQVNDFILKYPNMFNEKSDIEFWEDEIVALINKCKIDFMPYDQVVCKKTE